jgi:23S rRNA (uracil1939-C5)-methyltransferase
MKAFLEGQALEQNTHALRTHLYCNPPRTGLEARLCEWIEASLSIRRIAYLSCSPQTLTRDLQRLASFQIKKVEAYDFFPNTHHLETLVLLVRRGTN